MLRAVIRCLPSTLLLALWALAMPGCDEERLPRFARPPQGGAALDATPGDEDAGGPAADD